MAAAVCSLTNNAEVAVNDRSSGQSFEPAVTVRKSLSSRDQIISLIDGKPYKTVKRHLANRGLTPDQTIDEADGGQRAPRNTKRQR